MANTFRMTNEASVTTAMETIYAVPSATTTVVIGIMLSNTLAVDLVRASVQIVSTTATSANAGASNVNETTYLVKNAPVDNSSSLELMAGNKIVLQAGDILRCQAGTASALDIAISYMEIT
jgi:hypothetical protein|tara:strand:+ start:68 stop:430 length:363 start_codon:yes stop_codon:yes gene_type:complete